MSSAFFTVYNNFNFFFPYLLYFQSFSSFFSSPFFPSPFLSFPLLFFLSFYSLSFPFIPFPFVPFPLSPSFSSSFLSFLSFYSLSFNFRFTLSCVPFPAFFSHPLPFFSYFPFLPSPKILSFFLFLSFTLFSYLPFTLLL